VTDEQWLQVPDWPGYEVSDLGPARSVDRTLTDGRHAGGLPLKPTPDADGYLRVTLRDGQRSQTFFLHDLVMLTHVGPKPKRREVLHANGHKADCRLTNLSYGTHGRNERDKGKLRRMELSQVLPGLLGHK
jgi:hypothetical protein